MLVEAWFASEVEGHYLAKLTSIAILVVVASTAPMTFAMKFGEAALAEVQTQERQRQNGLRKSYGEEVQVRWGLHVRASAR